MTGFIHLLSIKICTIFPHALPSYVYECPSRKLESPAPPSAIKANSLPSILLIPSFTRVLFAVPGGPEIAIAVPIADGFVIHCPTICII